MIFDDDIEISPGILLGDGPARGGAAGQTAKTARRSPQGESAEGFTTHSREIRTELLRGFDGFLALAEPWTQLAGSLAQADVFATHEWFQCWWEAFGAEGRMVVPCLWREGRLIGAAAMQLGRCWYRGLPVRKLSFLANGVTGSAGFLIAPDCPGTLDVLMSELCAAPRSWDMMELRRINQQSLTWQRLTGPQGARPWRSVVRPDNQAPIISIEGTWEEFVSGRSKSFRKIIRRRLGGIDKCTPSVRTVCLTGREEILAALPDMFGISRRSWKAGRGRALTDSPSVMDFYRRLSDRLGGRGWVQLWLLLVGSTPVAFEYHLCYGGSVCPIRADFDERFARLSPGAHLEYEILRHLFEDPARNVREYNTCADDYAYERKWTDVVRSYGTARIFPKNLYGRLLGELGQLRRWSRPPGGPVTSVRQTT